MNHNLKRNLVDVCKMGAILCVSASVAALTDVVLDHALKNQKDDVLKTEKNNEKQSITTIEEIRNSRPFEY